MTDATTPSSKLALVTVDRLIAAGLLRADQRDALVARIASGQMKEEDWKLEVELAVEKATHE